MTKIIENIKIPSAKSVKKAKIKTSHDIPETAMALTIEITIFVRHNAFYEYLALKPHDNKTNQ